MDRRQLEYFLAIVQTGGFTSASRRLRVAQPSLSQAIRSLERDLGTPLFDRLGRGVGLTAAGEALVRPAKQVLRDFATARASVESVIGLTGGRLDIVALTTLAVDPLAGLIGRFRLDHERVDVRVDDPEHDDAVTGMVLNGDCELGLAESRGTAEGLDHLRLPDQEFFAVLPPGTGGEPDSPIPVAALANRPLVSTPEGTAMRTLVDRELSVCGTPPRVAVETTHRAAIVPLVLAGAGATVLPARLAEDAAVRGAVVVPTTPPLVHGAVMMWRSGQLSPAAKAFVDLARPVCAG
ncbi:LysR family transcriptional regulator [Cryptosporangium aurantiacum]|uniref:Transcriptional regulator, LysR family n=1 Tax=Cryptosporangium aurantiacum TaxID=134849 RepID=A0A1M7TW52_9ACTN|nr:LysR family transcriptional regulator [Cryptosporangium aurantiacum]SHN74910.1 transcriptional regulator, LysR family [Cryptosporangium aurantiacum]